MIDEDRIAQLALEFAGRIRLHDPDDVADWYRALTEQEQWALTFTLGAVAPTTEATFRFAKRWAAKAVENREYVDDIAVERACRGEAIQLNRLEKAAAVKRLARRGVSVHVTEKLIGVHARTIRRIRADALGWARDVA